MKRALLFGAALAIALSLAVLVVPSFIDLGSFKSTYLPLLEEAVQRRIDVGEVRLRLLPTPSIRLSSLKISDTPAFPDNTFFSAERVSLRLKLWPLLRRRFEITELVLDKPVVNLVRQPDGSYNYSDLAARKARAPSKKESLQKPAGTPAGPGALPLVLPSRLRIRDGQFNLERPGQSPLRIERVDLSLRELSADRPVPYRASFEYPGLRTIALEGTFSYRAEEATVAIHGNRLRVRDLALPMEGSITDLAGVPRVNLTLVGRQVEAEPIVEILAALGWAPPDTEISGPLDLQIDVTGPAKSLVAEIRGRFRDLRLDAKRALKGLVGGDVSLALPLGGGSISERLRGHGRLSARDGQLTNAPLIEKIHRAAGWIGMSRQERREATTFQSLESEFTIGGGRADFKHVYLINPQLEISGHGVMTLARPVVDMRLDAALLSGAGARSGSGRMVAFKDGRGRIVVPLRVTGRVQDPAVSLDRERALGRGIGVNIEKGVGSLLRNLFNRK